MQRLYPDKLGRLYHAVLYDRMVSFAKENTPEFPCEQIIGNWLQRFYAGDDDLQIIISINETGELTGHAILEIQNLYSIKAVLCHQITHDKSASTTQIAEGMEYLDKLRDSSGAVCSMITVAKNVKAYEKKYGYRILRTVMIKVSINE